MGRMVGVGYLVLAVSGFDLFYVLPKLLVRADAAATAANIKAHEALFLAGFAAELIGVASYLVVTVLLYRLYEPVNRTLSLCAALFSLTGCVVQAVALIFHLMPLLVLDDQPYLRAFTLDQRQALALVLFRSYGQAYNISLVKERQMETTNVRAVSLSFAARRAGGGAKLPSLEAIFLESVLATEKCVRSPKDRESGSGRETPIDTFA